MLLGSETYRQLTLFPIDFDRDVGWKVVILLSRCVHEAEPQLYLYSVVNSRDIPDVPIAGNICSLTGRQSKI